MEEACPSQGTKGASASTAAFPTCSTPGGSGAMPPCNAGEVVVEPRHDAYGQLLLAAFEGDDVVEIVERDDGFITASVMGPKLYLAPFRRWPSHHRRAMRYARGRVLDVGAGAGRVSLHLQERGQDVVAIDNSPGAIAVCRRRGVREARVLAFDTVDESLGTFNTIVLFGNNFGLFGTPTKAKQLLRRLHRMTSNDARIIVESRDVERRGGADAPWHRRYRERNIARGRLPGQIRIRVRFRDVIGPWMNYPMVSPDQLGEILAGTRWYVVNVFDSDDTYVAIIEKTGG
jgi:SAM-dependent methyltransferase